MRDEVLNYFFDPLDFGLLIDEAPTGYGKTYQMTQAISRYAAEGGKRQIFFITNLIKNLPYEDLRIAYQEAGREYAFESEVLRLVSAQESVGAVILTEIIPMEFQTQAYITLRDAYREKIHFTSIGGEAGTAMASQFEERIREKLEPAFRHELESTLRKHFKKGPGQRRNAIRRKEKYQWIAKFYPSVFWSDYKVILFTVQKMMARNITIVEPSFDCLSDKMLGGKIICIDEFDASRAVILDNLIARALHLKADYLQLFLQVYRGATTHSLSLDLERCRTQYETGGNVTWQKLLLQAREIYNDNALYYSIKTAEEDIDKGRNFLFHDTSYHTVLDHNKTHVRAVRNDERKQVQIHFETREGYETHRGESHIVVQSLLRRIYVFLQRFRRYVYGWADGYARTINAQRTPEEDQYTVALAAESIMREYGLSDDQIALLAGETGFGNRAPRNVITPDLSFYETGFRLFEFSDDDRHRSQTYLQYLQMENTPEKVLLYICRRAKVVGMSATAALPTVTGNYDLDYLREQLQESYRELSTGTKEKICGELDELWAPYHDGRIRIDLQIVDSGSSERRSSERLSEIFSLQENSNRYAQRFLSLGISEYAATRYCNIFASMRFFWQHPDICSFLCLNQIIPSNGKAAMDITVLQDALEDLRQEITPQGDGCITVLRSGNAFEADKTRLLNELSAGKRHFIFSSYQTLGAGQNLQYNAPVCDKLICLTENSSTDSRTQKKDMDALYLGDVTHVAVNIGGEDGITDEDLLKYCFQAECLYQNDEISYRSLNQLLKDGIRCYLGGRSQGSDAQSALRKSTSLRRQITRDVIQAVGRISRTFLKRPVVYVLTTESLLGKLEPSCLQNRILCPEMQSLANARIRIGNIDETDIPRCEAERKSMRGNAYIMRMLSAAWSVDSMELWKTLRQTVLAYPRADDTFLAENAIIRAYYIPLQADKSGYNYAQKGDFSEIRIDLQQDRAVFSAQLPADMIPSAVNEEEARLSALLAYPGMREHFIENGWATSFGRGLYIMSPVLFQNIYKGALGEVAGRFIVQRELGLALQEIGVAEQFELFDYMAEGGLYFDFKHWKETTQMNESDMRKKISAKLEEVGGKRVFIVNIFSDNMTSPVITADNRIVEVTGLLLPSGQINHTNIDKMRRFLL